MKISSALAETSNRWVLCNPNLYVFFLPRLRFPKVWNEFLLSLSKFWGRSSRHLVWSFSFGHLGSDDNSIPPSRRTRREIRRRKRTKVLASEEDDTVGPPGVIESLFLVVHPSPSFFYSPLPPSSTPTLSGIPSGSGEEEKLAQRRTCSLSEVGNNSDGCHGNACFLLPPPSSSYPPPSPRQVSSLTI
ncbi:hypothetical protein CDAR_526761 [Caerostris darwini]|uniref:Uncharacterized protein n=1 Tax=Caerostris darwini TaxID=1538125 RepID=A0AAV4Q221_9ARAC|nr:hypothetical protein CDAR_526761 [Caerostris darwini]